MSSRIRWEDEPPGYAVTADGFIGSIGWRWRAFKIWNPDARVDPRPFLTSDLPGWDRSQQHGTPDELKAEAERWLEQFVVSLGAIFPEKRTCPSCYGGGHDGTVNRNDCPTCKGSGDVLRVPDEPPKETGQ